MPKSSTSKSKPNSGEAEKVGEAKPKSKEPKWTRLKDLARAILLPLAALGFLGALLWFGNAPKVIGIIEHFQRLYLLFFLFSMIAHEAVRGALWLVLVRALAVDVPIRTQIFAFAIAESFKAVPAGAYMENYLLERSGGSSAGRSSAATTFMILGEIITAMVGVVALGLGFWHQWLRLAAIIFMGLAALVVILFLVAPHLPQLPKRLRENRVITRMREEIKRFRVGTKQLMRPRIIAVTLALCALYVLLDSTTLYIVIRALDITGLSYAQVVSVACFGLAFYVVLASLEAAEVGILIGLGLSKSMAVGAILIYRALSICTTILLAAIVIFLLRTEWRSMRTSKASEKAQEAFPAT